MDAVRHLPGSGLWRRWARCVPAIVGASAAMVVFAVVPAAAAPTNAGGTRIIAFADSRMVGPMPTLDSQLSLDRLNYCLGRAPSSHGMSVAAAVGVAAKLVGRASHGRGLAAFTRGREGHNVPDAMTAAAGALSTGKLEASLAALVRAHQLMPSDPVPLIDAAPLLTQDGQPGAALALLSAAQRLRLPGSHPFGLDWRAVIAANRGYALIGQHRWAAAANALGAALRRAPLLVEADQNMAVALECQGKHPAARRFLAAAGRRQAFQKGDLIGPTSSVTSVDPVEILDTSQGQTLVLETFTYPQSVSDGHAMRASFLAVSNRSAAASVQAGQQLNADEGGLNANLARDTPATQQRTMDIENAVTLAGFDPDLNALHDTALAVETEIAQLFTQTVGQAGCLDNGASHAHFLSLVQAYDTDWRAYAVALYARQTALAANLSDSLAHQVALDTARLDAEANFATLVNGGGGTMTAYDAICDTGNPPQQQTESGQRQEPASGPCPAGIGGLSFAIDLKIITVSVTCEKVSGKVGFGQGWLTAFISASHNFRKGSTTVFAGAQVGVKLGGQFGASGNFRSGAYITFGADGSVQDVGLRAGPSASLRVGPLSVSAGDQMDFSFVGRT